MSPMELVIHFKGEKRCVGLIYPESCSVDKIRVEALKITGVHGLNEAGQILLTVMNPDNKAKVVVDSDFGLNRLFGIHNSMGLNTFEVEVINRAEHQSTSKVRHPTKDEDDLLSNWSGKRLDSGDDDEGDGEEPTVLVEDDLLSEWSDKGVGSNDDDDGKEGDGEQPPPTVSVDDTAPVEDSDDSDGSRGNQHDSDSDADIFLDDDTREFQMAVNSSDEDMNLGSVQFRNYLEKHEYKLDGDGVHRLRVVMCSGILNDRNGFWLRGYHKKHECRLTKKSVKVTSTWIAEMIKGHVAIDANVKISLLRTYMQEKFRLKIEKLTMYRAREKARVLVYGDHSKGYEKLFQYAAAIHQADPGAICKVLCDTASYPEKCLFQRFFVAFPAQKNAFLNGCRPFIGIDGCHLKGKYGGVLLAAIATDANKGIVPLAICVCEIENTETWTWFLEHLHNYLDDGRQVTFISDRQKGLLNAIPNTWPSAYHRACCRHVYANFAKDHAGAKLRNLFWRAAKSSNRHDFNEAMALIKEEKIAAYNWLERELQGYTWSMHAYDRNCKVERTNNNASECFNSWILPYRDRPVLSMLEEIRCRLMKRFTKRKNEAKAWAKSVTPRIYKELDTSYKKGEKMTVHPSGDLNFQVMDKSYYPARKFVVKLEDRTCDCGYWEIAGLPCSHAMACIGYARHEIEEYIPFCFTKQAYINTYSVMFSPIPDERTWDRGERPLIDPPIVQKKIGRPKKCRKRAATEPQKRSRRFFVNCSVCGGSNHNVRSCPLRPSVARAARARSTNSQFSDGNASAEPASFSSQPATPSAQPASFSSQLPTPSAEPASFSSQPTSLSGQPASLSGQPSQQTPCEVADTFFSSSPPCSILFLTYLFASSRLQVAESTQLNIMATTSEPITVHHSRIGSREREAPVKTWRWRWVESSVLRETISSENFAKVGICEKKMKKD
ncbi:SWIM-type domain-containing protein [Citrus sinensis]|nr:SWIM-type domain-containing protein [Citrus sinensis]